MTSKEQCCDDRFEIINETKQYIINATNIETSPEEMNVLDSICFRLWQLGLTKRNKDKLKELTHQPSLSECIKEWEEKGYAFIKHNKSIEFRNNEKEELFFFDLEKKAYAKTDTTNLGLILLITNEEHNLIHKTLKALEVEND